VPRRGTNSCLVSCPYRLRLAAFYATLQGVSATTDVWTRKVRGYSIEIYSRMITLGLFMTSVLILLFWATVRRIWTKGESLKEEIVVRANMVSLGIDACRSICGNPSGGGFVVSFVIRRLSP
ncbi:ccch zinc finger protein, partial [Moniliophthora roreri]